MKSLTTAALGAGAPETCAQTAGSAFRPILRWDLYGLIKTCKKRLGLNTGDLTALQAMLSLLDLKDAKTGEVPATPDKLLICFASNTTICQRAAGMDESNLRKHIRKLVDRGLVRRRNSATGKRFPLKRDGKIVDAYGIDLTPAFQATAVLQRMSEEIIRQAEERRNLRAETLSLRRRALECLTSIDDHARTFLDGLTNLLRRETTTIEQIEEARSQILELLASEHDPEPDAKSESPALPAGHPATQPDVAPSENADEPKAQLTADARQTEDRPVSNGHSTRQVESQKLNIKKRPDSSETPSINAPLAYEAMLGKYPHASSFLPPHGQCRDSLMDSLRCLGLSLGLHQVPFGQVLRMIGLEKIISIFDHMIQKVEMISHPLPYFEQAVRRALPAGTVLP